MKKLLISALLAVAATTLFSSCQTTVPRDNANVSSTSTSTTYSK